MFQIVGAYQYTERFSQTQERSYETVVLNIRYKYTKFDGESESNHTTPPLGRDVECDSECGSSDTRHNGGPGVGGHGDPGGQSHRNYRDSLIAV